MTELNNDKLQQFEEALKAWANLPDEDKEDRLSMVKSMGSIKILAPKSQQDAYMEGWRKLYALLEAAHALTK